ncbi:sigmaY antisigma factor component [Cohnella boryungensis]|uniref:SigmaY antisigma factor component n=1 Tax=Cohnella boryungensis TaxID=768479 RepID=A0ABV8SA46_9BACL
MNEAANLPWWLWTIVGLILLGQGTALFLHARRIGRNAWFWGVWGLIQFPTPSLVYGLSLWWRNHKRKAASADRFDKER